MSNQTVRPKLVLAAALWLGACAHEPERKPVVWPDPPEKPRITFVTAFRSTEDLDPSRWAVFRRAVLGGDVGVGMRQPMGLALSADGRRLFVADYAAADVLVADFDAKTLRSFAAGENVGRPFGVAVDADENVYVVDTAGAQIVVLDRHGKRQRSFGGKGDLIRPLGIAIDRQRGRVYVSDSATRDSPKHRVAIYDLAGKPQGDLGPVSGPGGKGDGDGQFYFPSYLAVDGKGNVFVGDAMNFRVQVFGPNGKFLRKFGQNGNGPGDFARLKGLAFDGFGNLYVVDAGPSVVQMFNRADQILMWFGGFQKKLEYFDVPSAIAIDPKTNRIYVANTYLARVNVYDLVNTTAADAEPAPEVPPASAGGGAAATAAEPE